MVTMKEEILIRAHDQSIAEHYINFMFFLYTHFTSDNTGTEEPLTHVYGRHVDHDINVLTRQISTC